MNFRNFLGFNGLGVICALTLTATASFAETLTQEQAFSQYNEIIQSTPAVPSKNALPLSAAQTIFTDAVKHPVAALTDENVKKYDPDGIIGFCFGRSMVVHMAARRAGLVDTSIRKLFIVGDLTQNPPTPEWRFHVATLIRVKPTVGPASWYAIDPIMKGPMKVQDWITYVRKTWDYTKKSRLYVVKPDAILPDISVVPDIAKETGEFLIELKFDPTGKTGFAPANLGGQPVTQADSNATDKYFLAVNEALNPFQFLSIAVNGGEISYREYFSNLIQYEYAKLKGLPPPIFHFLSGFPGVGLNPWPVKGEKGIATTVTPSQIAPTNSLGSFRFDRIVK